MRLVISPHIDDEVLGCSSVLDADTMVIYLGANDFHEIDKHGRLREARKVSKLFGFGYKVLNLEVNNYKFIDVLDAVQDLINKLQPDEIYIPANSYNQDHCTTHKACFTAVRPHDRNFFVKKVFVYEQIQVQLWNEENFKPTYFKQLDIEKKITGYNLHQSQVRGHRSPYMLMSLARFRGSQSNLNYAEGFEVLRWVD